ncbi:hypothetical protein FQZ97_1191550 [compost metagenome]
MKPVSNALSSSLLRPAVTASNAASAHNMPLLMAAWLPLMRAAFRNPALQPTMAPPGNTSLGRACGVPLFSARAP